MGALMWIEVLGRDHGVAERHRFDDIPRWPVRIGRAPDNDVVLDDPHVAPHHAEVRMEADGRLSISDLGSVNGLRVEGSRERFTRLACAGHPVFILGRTRLRVRDGREPVAAELPLEANTQGNARMAVFGLGLLGISLLDLWLEWISTTPVNHFLYPILAYAAVLTAWTATWSVLTRIFTGHTRFVQHLTIAFAAVLAYKVFGELQSWLAYALARPGLQEQDVFSFWVFLALACLAHFRQLLPRSMMLVRVLVVAGLAGAVSVQWVLRQEGLRQSGHAAALGRLQPPLLRPESGSSLDAFSARADQVRSLLDVSRKRDPDEDGAGDSTD